jgi:hypothetical protein
MLELDEGKPSRPVLRRGDGSNSVSLAGSPQDVMLNYLSFAQINDNELRPEQGEQTRGQSFGKWVRWVEYDL